MPETHDVTSIYNEGDTTLSKQLKKYNWKITKTGKVETPNTYNIYTWPLTFLTWYRHFNKKWRVKLYRFMGRSLPSPWNDAVMEVFTHASKMADLAAYNWVSE